MPEQFEPESETITVYPTIHRPKIVTMPFEPCVVVSHGDDTASIFPDDMQAGASATLTPIQRAVTIARLRAVADMLEGSE